MSTAINEVSSRIETVKPSVAQAETIPLSKLSSWKGNVRKTGITDGLDELTASIRAQGILVPLIVQKGDKSGNKVIAGQRRLAALRVLQKEGTIPTDHPVPCIVVSAEADAGEISLTENVVRSQMHPADQFEAFRDLIDKGSSIVDVASRFGISETAVMKLMKLGRISPKLLKAYRKGDMNMEAVQAFTLTDDHAVQEAYWKQAKGWQREARSIRDALTKGEVKATDSRVRFVGGVEAYEAAGGTVRRDLFDMKNAGYVSDLTLLNQLVVNRLEALADEVRAEGWKWVEIMPQFDWGATRGFDTINAEETPLTPEQDERLSQLVTRQEKLNELRDENDLSDEQESELDAIEAEIEGIEDRPGLYCSEDIRKAGAFISINYDGRADIRRGYVRPEDQERAVETARSANAELAIEENGIPASLVEDMTAQRTAAMRVELSKRPSLALALTVYTLASSALRLGHSPSCLKLTVQQTHLDPLIKYPEDSEALKAYIADNPMIDALPTDSIKLWHYCLERSDTDLMALLAVLVSHGVDAVTLRSGSNTNAHAGKLADALGLDMREHFTPTAESYFSRLPKAEIIKALIEMDGGEPVSSATEKLKKAALAAMAETTHRAVAPDWLPIPLRSIPTGEDDLDCLDLDDAA